MQKPSQSIAIEQPQSQQTTAQSTTKLKDQHLHPKQILPATQQQIQQLKQSQQQVTQKQKSLPIQQQKQLLQQKPTIQAQHYQPMQHKYQSPKPQVSSTNANDPLALNSQARQELHRHLNEMKAIAQSAAAQQNQNAVTSAY